MEIQYIKVNQCGLLVWKMTQAELDQVNRYINNKVASRSMILDKSDDDLYFLTHVYPLKALKTMRTLSSVMQDILSDYCKEYTGQELIAEPAKDILFGIELVNKH